MIDKQRGPRPPPALRFKWRRSCIVYIIYYMPGRAHPAGSGGSRCRPAGSPFSAARPEMGGIGMMKKFLQAAAILAALAAVGAAALALLAALRRRAG